MRMTLNLYMAQVTDNNDPRREGRVKIFIPSIMEGWDTDLLPWARPFFNKPGGQATPSGSLACYDEKTTEVEDPIMGESFIPENYTSVWVWISNEDEFKNCYYLSGVNFQGVNPHMTFERKVAITVPEMFIKAVYPDVKYLHMKSGMNMFVTSTEHNPEIGFVSSSNLYFYANDDQSIEAAPVQKTVLKTGTTQKLEMNASTVLQESKLQADPNTYLNIKSTSGVPAIELKAGQTTPTEKMILGETLKAKLEELIDAIKALTVNTGVGPSSTPNNASQFDSIKFSLNTILSDYIKNN